VRAWQVKRIEARVSSYIDEGDDSLEELIGKKHAAVEEAKARRVAVQRVVAALNPYARVLGPVQRLLASLVPRVRQVRYALLWNDRILTLWLAVALGALTLVLALIPWAFVLLWSSRLVGLALLGPHMVLVGRGVDRARRGAREEAREYRQASPARQVELLLAYEEKLMAEARVQVSRAREEQLGRSERDQMRLQYLHGQRHLFMNSNTLGNANIKYIAAADITRSKAHPVPSGGATATAAACSDAAVAVSVGLTDLV